MIKNRLKITAILLIQALLLIDMPGYCAQRQVAGTAMLSPRVNISGFQMREVILAAMRRKAEEGARSLPENNNLLSGTGTADRVNSLSSPAKKIHNVFAGPYNKLVTLLGFIIKGKNAKKRIPVAALMITVNGFVDCFLILPLKTAVFAASVLTGSLWLIAGAVVFAFVIGGIVRLMYYPVFKVIWPDLLRLTDSALLLNFIPWGLGNLAPVLMVSENTSVQDVVYLWEVKRVAKVVGECVRKHSHVTDEQMKILDGYFEEIAQAICSYQNKMHIYNYNRFKIRGSKNYSEELIRRDIVRNDFTDRFPFWIKLRQEIFKIFKVKAAGYRKGTRPALLIDTQDNLSEIKENLKQSDVPKSFLSHVYKFDLTEFMNEAQVRKEKHGFTMTRFIQKVFTEEELEVLWKNPVGIHTVAGSDGCFYVLDEQTKRFFEQIEDGTQINIIAPGGGGDTLAAIKIILQLKKIFERQGKKNILFRVFFSNVKYGIESPFAGPVPAEFIKGIIPLVIEGFEKSHFYKVTGKLEVKIPITDVRGKQIVLGGIPFFYNTQWGEGEVVEEGAKMGIELVMMDFCPKASELKEQYSKLTQGKKVVTFVCDVGGDILARIPQRLQSQEQLEITISSPVSDITGLIFDGPVLLKGLGGDGEAGERMIWQYLPELFKEGAISGLLDDLSFYKKHPDLLESIRPFDKKIRGEVSKNVLRRQRIAVKENWTSFIEEYGPWNYDVLLKADDRLDPGILRYEERREFLPGLYLATMMIRDTSILREKIKDKKVLSPELTWEQRSKYLQLLNYATEDTSFIVYRSRIKYLSKKLFELLQNEECGVEDLKGLFFNKDVPLSIRLSAVRAIYMFKHFISDDEVLTAEIGKKLLRLMDEKGIDIFLIDEIVKTFGVIGYPPAADTLLYFLKNPEKYGKWNFYPGHFQEYANTRLKNTAERAILTMIRKLLMVEGPEKALALFNKAGVTNEEFERVKLEIQTKQLETRTRAWRLGKNIDDNNAVMKNTGSLFECERLCLTAI